MEKFNRAKGVVEWTVGRGDVLKGVKFVFLSFGGSSSLGPFRITRNVVERVQVRQDDIQDVGGEPKLDAIRPAQAGIASSAS